MLKVIKNQEYQTFEEVESAAKLGQREAILSSIRHWRELATAPVGDLVDLRWPDLAISSCALCMRDDDSCKQCALYLCTGYKCYCNNSPYNAAKNPYLMAKGAVGKAFKDAAIKRFRRAAEKMVKVLESCL